MGRPKKYPRETFIRIDSKKRTDQSARVYIDRDEDSLNVQLRVGNGNKPPAAINFQVESWSKVNEQRQQARDIITSLDQIRYALGEAIIEVEDFVEQELS